MPPRTSALGGEWQTLAIGRQLADEFGTHSVGHESSAWSESEVVLRVFGQAVIDEARSSGSQSGQRGGEGRGGRDCGMWSAECGIIGRKGGGGGGEAGGERVEVDPFVHAQTEDCGVFHEQRRGERRAVLGRAAACIHVGPPLVQVGDVGAAPACVLRGGGGTEADPRVHAPRIEIVETCPDRAKLNISYCA